MIIEGPTMDSYRFKSANDIEADRVIDGMLSDLHNGRVVGGSLSGQMMTEIKRRQWREDHPVRAWLRDRWLDLVTWRPTSKATRTVVVLVGALAYAALSRACDGGMH